MAPTYWLDLFTLETWKEIGRHGSTVSGFAEGRRKTVERMRLGDYLLSYLTGVSRWIGLLEVYRRCLLRRVAHLAVSDLSQSYPGSDPARP